MYTVVRLVFEYHFMSPKFQTATLILLLLAAGAVNAGQWVYDPVPADNIEVANANMGYSAGVYFHNPAGFDNPFGCAVSTFVSVTDPKLADRALTLALYAESLGKKLRFYITRCDGKYIAADSVSITK